MTIPQYTIQFLKDYSKQNKILRIYLISNFHPNINKGFKIKILKNPSFLFLHIKISHEMISTFFLVLSNNLQSHHEYCGINKNFSCLSKCHSKAPFWEVEDYTSWEIYLRFSFCERAAIYLFHHTHQNMKCHQKIKKKKERELKKTWTVTKGHRETSNLTGASSSNMQKNTHKFWKQSAHTIWICIFILNTFSFPHIFLHTIWNDVYEIFTFKDYFYERIMITWCIHNEFIYLLKRKENSIIIL